MFLSRNKKNNVYPCKHQFYNIIVGFKGSKLYRHVFVMWCPFIKADTENKKEFWGENLLCNKISNK